MCSYYAHKHRPAGRLQVVGFGGMEDVRFRDPVRPGDRLVVVCKMLQGPRRRDHRLRFQASSASRWCADGQIKGIPLPVDALVEPPKAQTALSTSPPRRLLEFMGRRALRKIDPALDLSAHLKLARQLPRPLERRGAVRPRTAPLEIEVGSGKGCSCAPRPQPTRDAISWASRSGHNTPDSRPPGWRKRGSDERASWFTATRMRLFRASVCPTARWQAVHVYFPDPWWKARHKKAARDERGVSGATSSASLSAGRHAAFLDRRRRVFPD